MDELEQLTALLVSPEKERIHRLEQRLDDPNQRSQEIAKLLPAIVRACPDSAALISALQPAVNDCVYHLLHQEPHSFVKALLPVIGPLMRRIDLEGLKPFQQHQQQLEHTLNTLTKQQRHQHTQLMQHLEHLEQAQVNYRLQLADLNKFIHQQVHQRRSAIQQLSQHLEQHSRQLEQLAADSDTLTRQLNDPQQRLLEIVTLLPQALQYAEQPTHQDDSKRYYQEKLLSALQYPVEHCLQKTFKYRAHFLTDSLFPLLGPTIRKSISETFKDLLQRINTLLEHSIFTRKGLIWRLQAWRSGYSFAEIVLMHTLVYRVEQIFLIHRHSGLLQLHVSMDDVEIGDSDAVSAMFTAIQDFIRDSFSTSKEEELDSVEMGQFTVWIERGPYAVLACVIRGNAPRHFRYSMKITLEHVHARYASLLEQFDGDNSALQSSRPLLEELLHSETKPQAQKPLLSWPLLILFIVVLSLGIMGGYLYFEHQSRLQRYLTALSETPGIIVLSSQKQQGQFVIQGLRDPLAALPQDIAQRFGLTTDEVVFKAVPYYDLTQPFVTQRLQQWLNPPPSVEMTLKDNVLYLQGYADPQWLDRVQANKHFLLGIQQVNTQALLKHPFKKLVDQLQHTPGIIVIASGYDNQRYFIKGLRDPLAPDPQSIAKQFQLTEIDMHWDLFQDLTPHFIEKRLHQRLAPPASVQLGLKDNILYLQGHAPQAWIEQALQTAPYLSGIQQVNHDKLEDTDSFLLTQAQQHLKPPPTVTMSVDKGLLTLSGYVNSSTFERLHQQLPQFKQAQTALIHYDTTDLYDVEQLGPKLIDTIEQTTLYFSEGNELIAQQEKKIKQLVESIQHLIALTTARAQRLQIQITGNTDGLGNQAYNEHLSQQRAQTVMNHFIDYGIEAHYLIKTLPAQIRFGEYQPNPTHRNVTLRVTITQN